MEEEGLPEFHDYVSDKDAADEDGDEYDEEWEDEWDYSG